MASGGSGKGKSQKGKKNSGNSDSAGKSKEMVEMSKAMAAPADEDKTGNEGKDGAQGTTVTFKDASTYVISTDLAPPRRHAFKFTKNHGISVEEEVKYFCDTILQVLDHFNCDVEGPTRYGVYQLILTHIDHPRVVGYLNNNAYKVDVLIDFLGISAENLDNKFMRIQHMPQEIQYEKMLALEGECAMIMGAYGNFLAAPIKYDDDCLEKMLEIIPFLIRWKAYWNDFIFTSLKYLPFGPWANFTRDVRRCVIICHKYEDEIRNMLKGFKNLRYHSDILSLVYAFFNISMTKPMRVKFFHDPEVLEILASYINMPDTERQVKIFLVRLFVHLCIDSEIHDMILDPDRDILGMILRPITGCGNFSDDEVMQLPNIVCANIMSNGKLPRDEDLTTREAVLEFLWSLACRSKSRESLRDQGIYYLLRELHTWEAGGNEELGVELLHLPKRYRDCLEGFIQVMIQTEQELEESGEVLQLIRNYTEPEIGDISRFVKPKNSPATMSRLEAAISTLAAAAGLEFIP